MTKRPSLPAIVFAAAIVLPAGTLRAQQAEVKMEGICEKLVIGGLDITQNCKQKLVNSVTGGRTTFDFAAWDGQTLSFSGAGAQQAGTEESDPLQPISLVVPGMKSKDGISRAPSPAVGACRFSTPEPGKTRIACEATSQGKDYTGIFVTDAKQASGDPKR